MLSLRSVCLRCNGVDILREIDLAVAAGEVVVVLGPNGAGKSSLLKTACGELPPSAGAVLFDDRALADWPLADKARRMAVLPQHSQLSFPFSATEVVLLGRTPHASGVSVDREIVAAALALMDVSHLQQNLYTRLSGGEKQRVQLARVLAQVWPEAGPRRRLLVLDEPTAALDYRHQKLVAEQLLKLARGGCSVIAAMHDLNLAASCADKLALMCRGEVRAFGSPEEVLCADLLQEIFEVPFQRLRHPQTGRPWMIS